MPSLWSSAWPRRPTDVLTLLHRFYRLAPKRPIEILRLSWEITDMLVKLMLWVSIESSLGATSIAMQALVLYI